MWQTLKNKTMGEITLKYDPTSKVALDLLRVLLTTGYFTTDTTLEHIESLKRALNEVTEFRKNGPKNFKKLEDLLADE